MFYLKRLALSDGIEIYQMLQEISANDNGFHNKAFGITFDDYQKWITKEYAVDNGALETWMVPQTSYWLFDDKKPIGYGRVRHSLNNLLKETSGHIGYAIRTSERGKGYGNIILSLLLKECQKIGIPEVQIGANVDNIPSNKVIQNQGGTLLRTSNGKNFYIIKLPQLL